MSAAGRRNVVALVAGAVVLLGVYMLVTGPLNRQYLVGELVTAGCIAIAVVGLALVIGGSHQFHLGQGFLYGLGAYWTAVATGRWSWPPLLALVSAVVVSCVVGWLIARVLNRVSGLYFAIATLALAVIGTSLIAQMRTFTGGDNGLPVDLFEVGGWTMRTDAQGFAVVWCVALVGAFAASRYLRSRRGRAMRAVGRDEDAARALGISSRSTRTQSFVISSGYAALGGGLLAFSSGFLYPDSFGLVASIEMVVYVIVGGATIGGALVATGVLALIPLVFEQVNEHLDLVFGIVLVALFMFVPENVRGSVLEWRSRRARRLARRRSEHAEAEAASGLDGEASAPLREPSTAPVVVSASNGGSAPAQVPASARRHEPSAGDGRRPASTDPATLEVRGLSKSFGGVHAVSDVDLDVPTGHITSLVGPNGAGKSTLFGLIGGQIRASAGLVRWEGRTISGMAPEQIARLGIARTFQTSRPIAGFSVRDNVLVGAHLLGSSTFLEDVFGSPRRAAEERDLRERATEVLELVGLVELADASINELSYGQRRLLEIARALAAEPRLLMLDEPAAGLNSAETEVLGELLVRLCSQRGMGVLLVEHNLGLVMGVSDHVAVLDFGELIAQGSPQEVAANQRVVEAYLGTSGRSTSAAT